MKKLFLLLGLVTFLASCASTNPRTYTTGSAYSDYINKNLGYKYYAHADSYSHSGIVGWGGIAAASQSSQYEANSIALEQCNLKAINNDCYIKKEGLVDVWEKNVAHLKANEKKIEEEKKQQDELASLVQKQQTCETLGFEIGEESNGECVLKLMQIEVDLNKIEEEKTVYVQSGDSNRVAELLARQALRQQQMNNSLMLMQQGYNLLKPKPRINCNTTLMGWTCY